MDINARTAARLAANPDLADMTPAELTAESDKLACYTPSRFNDVVDRHEGNRVLDRRLAIRHLLAS